MKIDLNGETLCVTEITELAAANSAAFECELGAALTPKANHIEIDLSKTDFIDCRGIGALIAVRKRARDGNGNVTVRLRNPKHLLRRILNLTRMDRLFPFE